MRKELKKKYNNLKNILMDLGEVVVAYSGGVDSTFLLKVAVDTLDTKVGAIMGKSASMPGSEFNEALKNARLIGVEPIIIKTTELESPQYCNNPLDRCYHCKKIIFNQFKKYLASTKLKNLIDGSNFDDIKDYRPGSRALEELKIISPLKDAEFTKADIRELSEILKLSTSDKEALACLATRIAYGDTINEEKLKVIEQAEIQLRELGFKYVRARLQGEHLRIETSVNQIFLFFEDGMRETVLKKMKALGFKYISIDLQGYRMGSMNP